MDTLAGCRGHGVPWPDTVAAIEILDQVAPIPDSVRVQAGRGLARVSSEQAPARASMLSHALPPRNPASDRIGLTSRQVARLRVRIPSDAFGSQRCVGSQ